MRIGLACGLVFAVSVLAIFGLGYLDDRGPERSISTDRRGQSVEREEVVFWHFWGGADRATVEDVVRRFNESQPMYRVRAIAMPGNNLDLKVFLAVSGGDPPDLINQDDPVVGDWASRGVLMPLDQLASASEMDALDRWLVPAARELGQYDGRYYALCNGLDIRALYYNQTILDEFGLAAPETLADLDQIAIRTTRLQGTPRRFGYLPDPRRLWAWGTVFGGDFYNEQTKEVTLTTPPIVAALKWMQSYRERYGADNLAAFRQADQTLPGKTFPLLAERYVAIMDGQWRVRDIAAFQRRQREAGQSVTQFGVCPLPPPPGGQSNAGWVNGNFFVIPARARQAEGAWAFMQFWTGFGGQEAAAARTCAAGGWIPVSHTVTRHPTFQQYLADNPLMKPFVRLAESPFQRPTPRIPGAPFLQREVQLAAQQVLYRNTGDSAETALRAAEQRVQQHLAQQNRKPGP